MHAQRILFLSLFISSSTVTLVSASEGDTKKAFDVEGRIAVVPEGAITFEKLRTQSRWAARDLIRSFGQLDDNELCVRVHYSSKECLDWTNGGTEHPVLGYSFQTDLIPASMLHNRTPAGFTTGLEGDLLMLKLPGTEKTAQLTLVQKYYYPWHIALRYEFKRFSDEGTAKILKKEIKYFETAWKKEKEALQLALLNTMKKAAAINVETGSK